MMAHHKRTRLIGPTIVIMIAFFGAFLYLQPHMAIADMLCPPDWAQSSSREVRDRCGEQKHLVSVQRDQEELAAKAGQPYVQRWPGFTPQKLPKPTGADVGPQE